MVLQGKRSPFTNAAWVKIRTPSHLCTELVGSVLRSERAFFFSFFKGFRFFRLLEQSDIVIIIEILEACTYTRKRKVFISIAIATFD